MTKTVKLSTLIFMCISIFSCSSNKEAYTEKLTPKEEQLKQFANHTSEWESLKPDLIELIEMKKELQELMTELNKLADTSQIVSSIPTNKTQSSIDNIPSENKKTIVTPAVKNNIPTKNKNITASPTIENNNYAIQFGSFTDLSRLKSVWFDIKTTQKTLLNNKTAISEKTTNNKNITFYRLKAIPYSKNEAKTTCDILIKKNQNCIISTSNGNTL